MQLEITLVVLDLYGIANAIDAYQSDRRDQI